MRLRLGQAFRYRRTYILQFLAAKYAGKIRLEATRRLGFALDDQVRPRIVT